MRRRTSPIRYCTGCTLNKLHTRLWLGTYCLSCRIRSIPRRWRTFVFCVLWDLGIVK